MNKMKKAISRQLELMQAREKVILRCWYCDHVLKQHLNDGKLLEGMGDWDIKELSYTVDCHGGDSKLLRKRAKSAVINQMTEGAY